MDKNIIKCIKSAKTIYISTHIRPDGDAIGSCFAMYLALKRMGKDVHVIMPSYSKMYNFLGELKYAKELVKEDKYNLLICFDCSDKKRLSITEDDFKKAEKVIVFDHHKMSSVPSDLSYIDDESPATCELVYKFMKKNKIKIDSKIAGYIYMGIMTDTGSFNYTRTTSESYRIAAEMIDKGADFVKICKQINDTKTESKAKLMSYTIDNMETYFDGRVRISIARTEILNKLGVDAEDAEGMTNYLRMIEDTELAVYIRQISDNEYKASLRSEGRIDCSKLSSMFGGGGHVRAAGFDTTNMEEDKSKLIQIVGDVLDK